MDNLAERLEHPTSWLRKPRGRKRTGAMVAERGSRRLKLPYPRDYSLRVFYGPGLNPAIDQALHKIVGRQSDSSGCFLHGGRERDLEWDFRSKRVAVCAANRVINRVNVPGGNLLGLAYLPIQDAPQKIRRVEVWEEAPRRILNVGFQARGKGKP